MLRIAFVRPSGERTEIKALHEGHHIAVPSRSDKTPDVLPSARIWWDRKSLQKRDEVDYDRLMEVVSGDTLEISRSTQGSDDTGLVYFGTVLEALTDGPQIVILAETPFPEIVGAVLCDPVVISEDAPVSTCCRSSRAPEDSRTV